MGNGNLFREEHRGAFQEPAVSGPCNAPLRLWFSETDKTARLQVGETIFTARDNVFVGNGDTENPRWRVENLNTVTDLHSGQRLSFETTADLLGCMARTLEPNGPDYWRHLVISGNDVKTALSIRAIPEYSELPAFFDLTIDDVVYRCLPNKIEECPDGECRSGYTVYGGGGTVRPQPGQEKEFEILRCWAHLHSQARASEPLGEGRRRIRTGTQAFIVVGRAGEAAPASRLHAWEIAIRTARENGWFAPADATLINQWLEATAERTPLRSRVLLMAFADTLVLGNTQHSGDICNEMMIDQHAMRFILKSGFGDQVRKLSREYETNCLIPRATRSRSRLARHLPANIRISPPLHGDPSGVDPGILLDVIDAIGNHQNPVEPETYPAHEIREDLELCYRAGCRILTRPGRTGTSYQPAAAEPTVAMQPVRH